MKHLEIAKKRKISSLKFSDETYAQILDSLAIACADSILVCGNELLLARRNIEPRANHWAIIGGRMIAGEQPVEAAARKLFQETNLPIEDLGRFKFSEVYSAFYPVRQQPPQKNGSHTINFTYLIEINKEEKNKINLEKSEYQDFRWLPIHEIINFLDQEKEDIYIKTIISDAAKLIQVK